MVAEKFQEPAIKNKILMSAVASYYLIDTSQLNELRQNAKIIVKKSLVSKKVIDSYWDYLAYNATALRRFDGSGYIYGNLFVYLEEQKNIDLTRNEYDEIATDLINKRGNAHFLFTNKQRTAYNSLLDPTRYLLTDIQQFNRDFSGDEDEGTARLTLDAIQVLRDNLNKLQCDNQILLLIVG